MAQVTSNFHIPYPELSDTRDGVVSTTASGIIQIDEVIKAVSDLFSASLGRGLVKTGLGELEPKLGFGLAFNPTNDAIDVDTLLISTAPGFVPPNDYAITFGADLKTDIADEDVNLSFTARIPYAWESIAACDSGAASITQSVVFGLGKTNLGKSVVCFSFDKISAPQTALYPTFELEIDASDAVIIKALYIEKDVYFLAVQNENGAITLYKININTQVLTVIASATSVFSGEKSFDLTKNPSGSVAILAYFQALQTPVFILVNTTSLISSAPANLYITPFSANLKDISISSDNGSDFVAFLNENDTNLHAVVINGSGTVIEHVTSPVAIQTKLFSVTVSGGALVAYTYGVNHYIQISFKASTAGAMLSDAFNTSTIFNDIYGLIRNGTQIVLFYSEQALANFDIKYVAYTTTYGAGPVVDLSLSVITDVDISDITLDKHLKNRSDFLSNFLYPTNTTTPGAVFFFNDIGYHDGKNFISRAYVQVGGSQITSSVLSSFKPYLQITNTRNVNFKIKIVFPEGYVLPIADGELAFIELTDMELMSVGEVTITRDGSINGINTAKTGLEIISIPNYVPSARKIIVLFRRDLDGFKRILFKNGQILNVPGEFSPGETISSELGLIVSGGFARVKIGNFLKFDDNGAITIDDGMSGITDHNLLLNLQGGGLTERYHLTSAQHTALTDAGGVNNADLQHSHDHNTTTGLQGGTAGQYYHLTSAEYASLGVSPLHVVRVATVAPGLLAAAFANGSTVDGIVLVTGDRILIKDQVSGLENGIYTVNASGAPTRAVDYDASSDVASGSLVSVSEGSINKDSTWKLITNAPITVGVTSLNFQPDFNTSVIKIRGGDTAPLVTSGINTVAMGSATQASGSYSVALGKQSVASRYGQIAIASGDFTVSGDAQNSLFTLRAITTDNTLTEMTLDGSSAKITIPSGGVFGFDIVVVAKRADAANESAKFNLNFCVDRNGAITALVGTIVKTIIARDSVAWDIDAVINDVSDYVSVSVLGENTKTINWIASVSMSEIDI